MNFDPYYQNIVNGKNTGAVIAPNRNGLTTNLNPGFVQSIAPTPIILASQAGVGPLLRVMPPTRILRPASALPGVFSTTIRRFCVADMGDLSNLC